MKQLLFLLLFPCLCVAQYTGNAGQKITLGEQTTADGLVYRGLAADTTRKPSVDTMAYILLDTNTNIIWQYKKATNNAWTRVGGSISSGVTGTLPVENGGTGSATQNFVDLTTNQSVNGLKTFLDTIIVNKGIRFPATQSASTNGNTLDDYEEGAWTPAYEGIDGSAGSLAYASGYPRGRYTKIGRLVVATGEIELTNKGSWTSGVRISGLPFSTTANEVAQGFCVAGFVDFAAGELYLNTRNTAAALPSFYFDKTKDNANREILFTSAVSDNSIFYFSLTYQIF